MSKWTVFGTILISFLALEAIQHGANVDKKQVEDLPLNGRNVFQLANLQPGTEYSTGIKPNGELNVLQITGVGGASGTNIRAFSLNLSGESLDIPINFENKLVALGSRLFPKDPNDDNSPMIGTGVTEDFFAAFIHLDSTGANLEIVGNKAQYANSSIAANRDTIIGDFYNAQNFDYNTWTATRGPGTLDFQEIAVSSPGVHLNSVFGSYSFETTALPNGFLRFGARQSTTVSDEFFVDIVTLPGGRVETFHIDFVPHADPTDTPKETCITPVGTGAAVQIFAPVGRILETWVFDPEVTNPILNGNIGLMPDPTGTFVPGIGCRRFGESHSAVAWGEQVKVIDITGIPQGRNYPLDPRIRGGVSLFQEDLDRQPPFEPTVSIPGIVDTAGSSSEGPFDAPSFAATEAGTYLMTLNPARTHTLPQLVLPATEVVLSNHSPSEALVDFRVLGQAGDFLEALDIQLQPFESYRIDLAGTSSSLTPAWGWVSSLNEQISTVATYTFDVGGGPIPKVGVPATAVSRRWGLSGVVNSGINTGVAVSNPTNEPVQCTLDLFPSDGTQQGTAEFDLPGRGRSLSF